MKQIGCAFTAKYLVAIRLVTERTNFLSVECCCLILRRYYSHVDGEFDGG